MRLIRSTAERLLMIRSRVTVFFMETSGSKSTCWFFSVTWRQPSPYHGQKQQLHHLQFIMWLHGRNLRIMTAVTFNSNSKHHALIVMVVVDSLQVYALILTVLSSPRDVQACDEGLNASFEQAWRPYTVQARQHIATTFRVIPFGCRKRRLSLLHWSTPSPGW